MPNNDITVVSVEQFNKSAAEVREVMDTRLNHVMTLIEGIPTDGGKLGKLGRDFQSYSDQLAEAHRIFLESYDEWVNSTRTWIQNVRAALYGE